jgi:hypothetical protein
LIVGNSIYLNFSKSQDWQINDASPVYRLVQHHQESYSSQKYKKWHQKMAVGDDCLHPASKTHLERSLRTFNSKTVIVSGYFGLTLYAVTPPVNNVPPVRPLRIVKESVIQGIGDPVRNHHQNQNDKDLHRFGGLKVFHESSRRDRHYHRELHHRS